MPVKFNASNPKLNATIELIDITQDAYHDIVAFITARTGEQKTTAAVSGDAASPVTATTVAEPEAEEGPKEVRAVKRYRGRDPEMSAKLDQYFKEAANNDEDFEKVLMGSHDFASYVPEYADCTAHLIAKKLARYCQPGKSTNGKTPNGYPTLIHRWYVPVRKKDGYTLGEAIRRGREDNGISVKELAELIEYPPEVVKKWENDEYVPSGDGLSAMKLVLGASYFENIH